MLSRKIAKNKIGSIGIKFDRSDDRIITIVGLLIPEKALQATIAMNYTTVKADNQTMYEIPQNMLTGNTDATDVIFEIHDNSLTLYAVDGSANNKRQFSVNWRVSDNNTSKMIEKWAHIPSKTEAFLQAIY